MKQPLNSPMSTQVAPIQFGKYLLVERLGRGGMAEVWKARMIGPAGFQRTMVVKRILPHLVEDPHFTSMFVTEARLSARLNHGNIVTVYELGDVDGEYFLAMEYVRGRDLVNVMRAQLLRGVPPPGLGAYAVREVCRALGYAHALTDDAGAPLRLIHRDVSPSNVMVSFDGQVKLLDFGIAKALAEASENKTQTGTLKGKFGYMAPEQVEGREIDHRSDLFAVGIVLHESLTGRRLFKGAGDLQTIAMVREAKVDPPSRLNGDVPPELDRICLKALARMPNDRYRNCDELAQELDQVVHALRWNPERAAAFMRELFPDEPAAVTGQLKVAPDEAGTQPSGLTIGTLRRHERRWRVAVGAAGLLTFGGTAAWLLSRSPQAAPVSAPAAVAAPAPVAAPPPPPVAPVEPAKNSSVQIQVASDPADAEVFLDAEARPRGRTPLELVLPRGGPVHQIKLKAPGFQVAVIAAKPDRDRELVVPLARAPRLAPPPPAVAKKAARPSPRPKPHARKVDLEGGELADPFK